jgi:hypothetical protein
MSDPERLVESSESEVERLLLRAGRDGAPREARRRVLLAATGAAATSTLTAGNATGAAAAGKAALGAKAASLVSLKWVAVIGLASLGAVAGTVAVGAARGGSSARSAAPSADAEKAEARRVARASAATSPLRTSAATPPRPLVSSPSMPSAPPAPSTSVPELVHRVPPAGVAPSTVHGGAARASAGASAAVELTMLDEARSAIARGDPARALSTLDDYVRGFPHGALSPEACVLRIEALVAAGDRPAAMRAAQSFLQANPTSPYAQRIESLLGAPNP